MIVVLCLVLSVVAGVFWRMGGSGNYGENPKLWRRVGSTLCIVAVLALFCKNWLLIPASAMVFYGCVSYFGWINHIVVKFCKWVEVESEYWWNFFAENLMIQMSVVVINPTIHTACIAVMFAFVSAVGKVLIDADEDGSYYFFGIKIGEDVFSEFWHGFSNCLFLATNLFI